jgi:hypothetical protein
MDKEHIKGVLVAVHGLASRLFVAIEPLSGDSALPDECPNVDRRILCFRKLIVFLSVSDYPHSS